ncbi:MAG: BrnA antitoxin family protein [Acidobacteria bacterium]|nr:BrnA antitoxin family protein [Acidobacteriota bacterium]
MAKLKRARQIPRFESEASERAFWETHDTTGLVDWSGATAARFPNLKPSTETISLRLPAGLLAELRILANKRDVPYQSLLKVFLAERLMRERVEQRPAMPADRRVRPAKARSSKPSTRRARG